MKYLLFNMRLFPALLFSFLLVCFYSCKDEEILQIVVGPEPPKSENTIDDINSNLKALQRMVVAQEKGLDVRSCVALTASSYNVELSDGNSFIVHTEITPLDKGESPVYAPKLGVKKEGDIYYWTIDDDWLNIKDAKVAVTPELSSIPVVGMDEDGYWTVKCNDDVKTLKRRAEAGTVKSIFNQVDIKGKTVTFRFSDGSLPIAFTIDDKDNPDEPVMGDLRRPISPDKPAWIFHIDTW
ncbi:PL29 family lyase N-terminal domain-containing protein, partial [Bacteroides zhangwenhongii]